MAGAAKPFHICPIPLSSGSGTHTPPSGSSITPGMQSKVLIEGQVALVVGDTCICLDPPPNAIQSGSSKVFFGGQAAARMGDPGLHKGDLISQGSTKVIIGG
ncbi:MAG: PAAR domain-containing protein [Saprospiraceae bacterium]